jgi:hypothetical protein
LTEREPPRADDEIPVAAWHRGVGLRDQQSPARLVAVREEIDAVIEMNDLVDLVAYAGDVGHSPEARLLAGSKAEVIVAGSVDSRQKRPRGVSLEQVRAITAGLSSAGWRSPWIYGSRLDPPDAAVKCETPLPDG